MAGIERIHIVSDWNDWRIRMARDLAPVADETYRKIFANIGMPLKAGTDYIDCTKEEAASRYDWQEGIDVLLYFERGGKGTLQEKFLDFNKSTMTFEEEKGRTGKPGAWYTCTAQYYFTAYARRYRKEHVPEFQDWMLINLPALRLADGRGEVH